MTSKTKRKNTNFRQTEKEFRAKKINQILQGFRTNLPYRIYSFSVKQAKGQVEKIRSVYSRFSLKLPQYAKKKK
jgi:hypothetical protein